MERDQNLYNMREHITDEFMDKYNFGREEKVIDCILELSPQLSIILNVKD